MGFDSHSQGSQLHWLLVDVFGAKRDASGDEVRYKARLVAKRFAQVQRVDFH